MTRLNRLAGIVTVTILTAGLAAPAVVASPTPAHADATRSSEWWYSFLHLDQAHKLSQGKGVTVGVIDSGINSSHPDLAGTVVGGTDAWNNWKGNGQHPIPGGAGFHGTAMAGIIAGHGHGDNDGIIGVAPKARLLSVNVFPPGKSKTIIDGVGYGIRWAVDRGATVINLSVGGGGSDIDEEGVKYALKHDVVVVAAVGNTTQHDWISSSLIPIPGIIGVSSVDQSGNFSTTSSQDLDLGLAAPGVNITSASFGHDYFTGTGSSNATAIVSGVAALIRSKYPKLSQEQVVHVLESTATDKGAKGRDQKYGYGVVDPVKALQAAAAVATSTSPSPSAAASSTSHNSAAKGTATGLKTVALVGAGILVLVLLVAGFLVIAAGHRSAHRRADATAQLPGQFGPPNAVMSPPGGAHGPPGWRPDGPPHGGAPDGRQQ